MCPSGRFHEPTLRTSLRMERSNGHFPGNEERCKHQPELPMPGSKSSIGHEPKTAGQFNNGQDAGNSRGFPGLHMAQNPAENEWLVFGDRFHA